MTSIRPFAIACGVAFGSMMLGGVLGNVFYAGETRIQWTPGRMALAAMVLGGFVVFVYTLVPVMLRTFITAQIRIGNADYPMVQWLIAHEQTIRLLVWSVWTLGAAIALPFAVRDWTK